MRKHAEHGLEPIGVVLEKLFIRVGLAAHRDAQKRHPGDAGDRVGDGEQDKGGEDNHGRLPVGAGDAA